MRGCSLPPGCNKSFGRLKIVTDRYFRVSKRRLWRKATELEVAVLIIGVAKYGDVDCLPGPTLEVIQFSRDGYVSLT